MPYFLQPCNPILGLRIWFVVLIFLTYYPQYIPFAFHILLLRNIFLYRIDKIKSDSETVTELQERRNARGGDSVDSEPVEDGAANNEATLGWITTVTNILPLPDHTKNTLRWAQNLLGGKETPRQPPPSHSFTAPIRPREITD